MDRRTKGLFLLVGVVALVAIGVAIWALLFRTPAPPAIPDIAPAVEDNAQPTGEGEDKMPQAQGGGAVNLTYSDQVTLSGRGNLVFAGDQPRPLQPEYAAAGGGAGCGGGAIWHTAPGKPVGGAATVGGGPPLSRSV